MNILTFDIEEWYVEKVLHGGRTFKYLQFDETFNNVIDELDKLDIKATFFCVGMLANHFPSVVRKIADHGHEIACHSNEHIWLNKMTEEQMLKDTMESLKALEDVVGEKVTSYRAPAFSITPQNKWAISVLAECGIENDASIFPTTRDFGGYKGFPYDTPCRIEYEGAQIKEYPVSLTSVFIKQMAYSGGGYFRLFPYWFVKRTMNAKDYNICYFHMADFIREKHKMMSKQEYEEYFKESGIWINRMKRYLKSSMGIGNVWGKFQRLLKEFEFVNIQESSKQICWEDIETVTL